MNKVKTFEDLIVWQKAHRLVLEVYAITNGFPKSEVYGITSQMRRAATSVPANIAEGYTRFGNKEKIRFYNISQGSLQELKYFFLLCRDLNYITNFEELLRKLDEVAKLLQGLINSINKTLTTKY